VGKKKKRKTIPTDEFTPIVSVATPPEGRMKHKEISSETLDLIKKLKEVGDVLFSENTGDDFFCVVREDGYPLRGYRWLGRGTTVDEAVEEVWKEIKNDKRESAGETGAAAEALRRRCRNVQCVGGSYEAGARRSAK
jgi:hypothetical protein